MATGRPGLMASRQNTSRPIASTAALTWSSSPVETPPEVSSRSWPAVAASSARAVASGVIGEDPQIGRGGAGAGNQAGEQKAVGVENLPGSKRMAGRHDLVAGGEDRHAQAPADRKPCQAQRRRERDVLRPEAPSPRQRDRAGPDVLAPRARIRPAL